MYPVLSPSEEHRESVDVFAGYNHNLRIQENEFYDMKNLTGDVYPVLSPRKPRGIYQRKVRSGGMIAKDSLCYVDGSRFVINGYPVDMGLSTREADLDKQLVSMGAYVLIFPDKKYINTSSLTDFGNIEAEATTTEPVTFAPCKADGTPLRPTYIQPSEPDNPSNMELWMDTSGKPHSLKQWSESMAGWTSVATTYVRIQCTGIGKPFAAGDGVTITIRNLPEDAAAEQIKELSSAAVLHAVDDDSITMVGLLDETVTLECQVTVERKMPLMDYVVEHDNRLWGCRYGLNRNGDFVNELYACKLGDFKNWNCFQGISTDSYAVSLGTDGPFTGAITHAGYPLFFKETCLHKVYGQIPANFQVQTTACRGVQKGCHRSLAIVNEVLFYKARHAICAYDGSLPTEVSGQLGDIAYGEAVAAAIGNKYYVSMQERDSRKWALFAFDTAKGMWHKEDELHANQLCACRDELYCATDDRILTLLGSGDRYEEEVPWMAETGLLNVSNPERSYLKRINIRMVLEPGSELQISAQYDSSGIWENIAFLRGVDLRSFTVPVRPRRCDHLRLRLEGSGRCMVFSISKTMSGGSDKP